MKILWFTNTSSNAPDDFGLKPVGGGWISSLETYVSGLQNIELGISFFYSGNEIKSIKKDYVTYYGMPLQKGTWITRISDRHRVKINDEDPKYVIKVINEFDPDIIHIFGTERGYGKIIMALDKKVIFHLQGLLLPYFHVYYPNGYSSLKVLLKSDFGAILRGITDFHEYRLFRKKAERERQMIGYWKYFSGRTEWDKNYVKLNNPNAEYFHCDELMRKEFYSNEWIAPTDLTIKDSIILGTTISPHLYKGLDLIFKVVDLLNEYNICWRIFGINADDPIIRIIQSKKYSTKRYPNIKFEGKLLPNDLISHLKSCHFFVHPSYIDNSPNSVCEAMLLGMPVLSSSVGGIKTLITDKETGFLFNPYDKYDLAGLIVSLINDYEKAKVVGKNARQTAKKRHSPDIILSQLQKIYTYVYEASDF